MGAERFTRRRRARLAAAGIGLGRVAMGTAVIIRPTALPRLLGVDEASATRLDWAVRMFGARDAALGLGAVWAATSGGAVRPWLVAQAIGDGTDAAVFALGARTRRLAPVKAAGLAAFALSGVLGMLALVPDADPASPAARGGLRLVDPTRAQPSVSWPGAAAPGPRSPARWWARHSTW